MRKSHNKLYYGKYRCKTEFKLPGSLMFYPTTDSHLLHIKRIYHDAPDMTKLADFILQNRKKIKFRFQGKKAIFYTDLKKSIELINSFWEFWSGSESVDSRYSDLAKNVVGCTRLPHKKYQYQIHLRKDATEVMHKEHLLTLGKFIEANKENCLVTSRDVLGLLYSESAYFTGGYFYVTNERFLTTIYMLAQEAIDKVIQFRKVKNGSNKKTER